MRLTNTLLASILLFSGTTLAPAQSSRSQLIWENVKSVYEAFDQVQPYVRNGSGKTIYVYSKPEVKVEIYDEGTGQWILSEYIRITDYVGEKREPKYIKLPPGASVDLTRWVLWHYQLLGEDGAFQPYNKPGWERMPKYKVGKKYRLVLTYSERKLKDESQSLSPEFSVKPNVR